MKTTRRLYCAECPLYSIRLEELGYQCTSCLLPAFDEAYGIGCLRLSDVSVIYRVVTCIGRRRKCRKVSCADRVYRPGK